jgi:tRNA (guanosine-2'-O-)-methyltransferase
MKIERKQKSGFYGIGIYNSKTEMNIGTLWRSAYIFGADFIFVIGKRYNKQSSDTVKADRHIPFYEYKSFSDFNKNRPKGSILVGVEQSERSIDLKEYKHPKQAIYLLGAEDYGLPTKIMKQCQDIISIDTSLCLNVAVAGSIIMFDRKNKS